MTDHFDDERDEIIDGDITENNDSNQLSLSSTGEPGWQDDRTA